jgi:Short repeats of unknown function
MGSLGVAVVLAAVGLGMGAVPAAADPAADHRAFVQAGFSGTTDEEYRAWVEALAATPDGPVMHASATRALAGTVEQLRAYGDAGYLLAWRADEEIRVARLMSTATKPTVDRAIQVVLEMADPQAVTDFLNTGLAEAQYVDDRLAAARMVLGGSDNTGPALDDAAQAALDGTRAELREFIVSGQFVARAIDAANAPAPAAPVPAAPVPAAPVPAAPAPAAPAAAAPAAQAARGARGPAVLAVTGVAEGPLAALAAAAILSGVGCVVLARRRRQPA